MSLSATTRLLSRSREALGTLELRRRWSHIMHLKTVLETQSQQSKLGSQSEEEDDSLFIDIDPRIAFCLENPVLLEEVLAARERIPKLAHRFFSRVAVDVAQAVQGDHDAPLVHVELDAEFPKVTLYKHSWRAPYTSPARAGVALEWVRSSASFTGAHTGIWVDCRHQDGAALSGAIERLLVASARSSAWTRQNEWFPAHRIEQPSRARYWENLSIWRKELGERVSSAWSVLHPAVDEAIESHF